MLKTFRIIQSTYYTRVILTECIPVTVSPMHGRDCLQGIGKFKEASLHAWPCWHPPSSDRSLQFFFFSVVVKPALAVHPVVCRWGRQERILHLLPGHPFAFLSGTFFSNVCGFAVVARIYSLLLDMVKRRDAGKLQTVATRYSTHYPRP